MILKVKSSIYCTEKVIQKWVIIDNIKNIEYNNSESETLYAQPFFTTINDNFRSILKFFKIIRSAPGIMEIDGNAEPIIDYDLYCSETTEAKFFLNWALVTFKDDTSQWIIFDGNAYILSDEGKTIDHIR